MSLSKSTSGAQHEISNCLAMLSKQLGSSRGDSSVTQLSSVGGSIATTAAGTAPLTSAGQSFHGGLL